MKVIFRTWIEGGDTIAIFPEIPCMRWTCESYQHIGQHGACDLHLTLFLITRPAFEWEIEPLLTELKSIGYDDLVIVKRATHKMKLARQDAFQKEEVELNKFRGGGK